MTQWEITPSEKNITLETKGTYIDRNIIIKGVSNSSDDKFVRRTIKQYNDDEITTVGDYAFTNCIYLEDVSLPSVTTLENSAFKYCSSLKTLILPSVITTGGSDFQYCTSLETLSLPAVTSMGYYELRNNTSLKTMIIGVLNGNEICTYGSNTYDETVCTDLKIYVPKDLVEYYKGEVTITDEDTGEETTLEYGWNRLAKYIYAYEDYITIEGDTSINLYYNENSKTYTAPLLTAIGSINWSISGNATITQEGVVTVTSSAKAGDSISITASVGEYTATKTIPVLNIIRQISVDLNSGQWVDSGTTVDGAIVYKSDSGSYNVNSGKSTATITISGYTTFTFYIRSYAQTTYDYTEAFAVDTTATRAKGLFTTKGNQSSTDYVECTYTLDGGTHTIQVMYSKNASTNKYDDRGYFYIPEQ